MKYLRRYLIYAGLCLLLVCSANVASAQVVVGLESVSTTQTSAGRIIEFKISLSRPLTGNERVFSNIQIDNVLSSQILRSGTVIDYMRSTCTISPFSFASSNPLTFLSCLDAGGQDTTIRLELNNSFDTRKTIIISITTAIGGDVDAREDPNNSVLRYPGTAVFIRTKVFLEGALQ